MTILSLIASLKKGFFLEYEIGIQQLLIENTLNLAKEGPALLLNCFKLFRELCVLISRLNRNLTYPAHDQVLIAHWLDTIFGLTFSLLSSSFYSNEALSTTSYLFDFWNKISYSFQYSPGLAKSKEYIVILYKKYIEFYAKAAKENEDIYSAHEMTVLFKEPLASLSRISLEECGQWISLSLQQIFTTLTNEFEISTASGLLLYAGGELLKFNPRANSVNYQEPQDMQGIFQSEEQKFYSICGETASCFIQIIGNWKNLQNSSFLLMAYTSYLDKMVKTFCKNSVKTGDSLAVFAKIVIKLGWEDENKVLEYIINWILTNMILHYNIPNLFAKLTKVIKSIVENTNAHGDEKMLICGNLILKDEILNELFNLHFNRAACFLGNSNVGILCKNLYYSLAKLLFLVFFIKKNNGF